MMHVGINFGEQRKCMQADPGPGYRLLQPGEMTQKGDEWFYENEWLLQDSSFGEIQHYWYPTRRRVSAVYHIDGITIVGETPPSKAFIEAYKKAVQERDDAWRKILRIRRAAEMHWDHNGIASVVVKLCDEP